jgi:hypothetical protein
MWSITDGAAVLSPIAGADPRVNVGAMTEAGPEVVERLCELAARAGRREVCPAGECPLWENGACSLERLLSDEAVPSEDEDRLSGGFE